MHPTEKAFEEVYVASKDRLMTLATALTGDASAAEDVVHDVFAALVEDPWRLDTNPNLTPHLVVCVRNRALDRIRSNKRRETRETVHMELGPGPGSSDPGEQVAEDDQRETLLNLVKRLPKHLREVLSLRVWGELTFEEIAKLQGIVKSTAHERYCDALDQLRMKLAGG